MAAYAALVSLLNNIHQIQNHPHLSTSLDSQNIPPLLEKINFLLDFMEGNNYVGGSKEVQDLERKITSAAHAAEDLIESSIVDQIHAAADLVESSILDHIHAAADLVESDAVDQNPASGNGEASLIWPSLLMYLLTCVGCHVSDKSERPLDLHQINADMDAIMKEADELKEKHRLGKEQQPARPAPPGPLVQSGESAMVGLDDELIQLLDELTGNQSGRRIISVVGMGGTGKTTLAKTVYENLLIKEQFQFRAWATISQKSNVQETLSKLLSGLGESSRGTVHDLELKLHKTLSGRRYLIVLDDIWSVKAWNELNRFFPDNKNGSRILLTTRLSNVAKDCSSSLFKINLLNEENSWKLFCDKAFQDKHCPVELLKVGKKIVKSCKGLALSIVVIGGLLLKSPRTKEYWKGLAKHLKSIPNLEEKQESLYVLSLSYNHLPPHLKPCFLYMGVLEEDSEIRVSKLIKLWVAEGFIKPTGSRLPEEIAEDFVKNLIDRNLILVGKRRKYGRIGFLGIHDLLRDLCIKIGEEEEFSHWRGGEERGTERRLRDDYAIDWTGVRLPFARTFITRTSIEQPAKYKLLRVLDEGCYDREGEYFQNFNLRHFAYNKWDLPNPVWELPTSISLIWNLQTLIIEVESTDSCIVAPIEFWKMRQLRHVECYRIYIPKPPPSNGQDGLLMLENLQTFARAVNLRLCEEVCKIIPNIKKLHLGYESNLQGYDDSMIECLSNLDRLHKLEFLNLNFYRKSFRLPPRDVEKLTASFSISLKKLCLSSYEVQWDDLIRIGSLPELEVLKLESISFCEGEEWSPIDGQFRRLRFLEINYCDLERWDADMSYFPVLEKLILFSWHDLEEIPSAISDIPTLQLIRVGFCSDSATISAIRIKEDQLDNDDLQVQVLVPDAESFNQMLETEGLTTDNIKLIYEYADLCVF